jgi:3'(2'), 5'-bisphosphate nucleotidase
MPHSTALPSPAALLPILARIAKEAGALIMAARHHGVVVAIKEDRSPVTQADQHANDYIVAQLTQHFPTIPIISEEEDISPAQRDLQNSRLQNGSNHSAMFFLVDPLDGTKSFIRGEDTFTVNIGLIANAEPIAGVIYLPAKELLYMGSLEAGAFRQQQGEDAPLPIQVSKPSGTQRSVILSKYHPSPAEKDYIAAFEITQFTHASSSYKFCLVADGTANLYPRSGETMEWDTAAGHAILLAAGGKMTTFTGEPFLYGKQGFRNTGFLAEA